MVWDWLMSRYFFRCFFHPNTSYLDLPVKFGPFQFTPKDPATPTEIFSYLEDPGIFHHIMIYPPDVFFQHFCHWELGPVFPQKERDFRRPKLPAFFRKRAFKLRGGRILDFFGRRGYETRLQDWRWTFGSWKKYCRLPKEKPKILGDLPRNLT